MSDSAPTAASPAATPYNCNRNIDLNCDGKIESWEKADDIPRIVFGTFAMILWAHSLYTVLANEWYLRTKFYFGSIFSAAGTLELIFASIFSLPLMLLWWATYSNNLGTIDAFYVFGFVNNWYLASIYWGIWLLYVIGIMVRNYGTSQVMGDTYEDHSMAVMISHMILGLCAIVMQTVWADRFNFWYVKTQFLAGRDINSAKNNVWNYPASLGSTARSWYNYTENRRDAQKPIEKAESIRNAEEKAAADDNSMEF